MKNYRPKERDVILVYLGDSQAFWTRMQTYLKEKQRIIQMSREKLQQVQQHVEKTLARHSSDMRNHLYLATLYETQGKISEATSVLEGVLERSPNLPDIYMRLGSLYECQGFEKEALLNYQRGQKKGIKLRPAVCLREMPPTYNEFLVCALTSKPEQYYINNFDEIVTPNDDNLEKLTAEQSVIRLGFLGRIRVKDAKKSIGSISVVRHRRLLNKLSNYMQGHLVLP